MGTRIRRESALCCLGHHLQRCWGLTTRLMYIMSTYWERQVLHVSWNDVMDYIPTRWP